MSSLLDPHSPVALYHQLYLLLADRIRSGQLRPGEYLPGERDIAEHYQVGRITAVRALRQLASDGLVSREQGRGTRVNFQAAGRVSRGPRGDEDGAGRAQRGPDGRADGAYQATLIDFAYVPASAEVADALTLAQGAQVQQSVRILTFGDRPYCRIVAWVPADVGRHWERADLITTPLGALLERAGIRLGSSREQVTARLADAAMAVLLDIAPGSPLLEVARKTAGPSGQAVEYALCQYVPDRYRYHVTSAPQG